MPYTLFSRGRPIGETELGFPVVIREARFGWFVPNAEGERLMPLLAGPSPAIVAYMQRKRGGGGGEAGPSAGDATGGGGDTGDAGQPVHRTLLADVAEAAQYQAAFDLELRRPDGSVVSTSHIGLQDTEQLRLLGRMEMEAFASDPDVAAELAAEFDDEVRLMVELDDGDDGDDEGACGAEEALLSEWWDDLDEGPLPAWSPDDDEITSPPGERYQIYVALTDASALP